MAGVATTRKQAYTGRRPSPVCRKEQRQEHVSAEHVTPIAEAATAHKPLRG